MTVLAKFVVPKQALDTVEKMATFAGNVNVIAERVSNKVAHEVAERVKEGIYQQVFPVAPLTEAWKKRKAKKGLDTRIFMATRRYVDSIRPKKLSDTTWGVEADYDKFKFLEYGTKNEPARPHWLPVLASMQDYITTTFAMEVRRVLTGR